jgi:hypothetical protein
MTRLVDWKSSFTFRPDDPGKNASLTRRMERTRADCDMFWKKRSRLGGGRSGDHGCGAMRGLERERVFDTFGCRCGSGRIGRV